MNAVLPWALPCIRHYGQSILTMSFAALNHSLKQTYFTASEPVLRLGSWGLALRVLCSSKRSSISNDVGENNLLKVSQY